MNVLDKKDQVPWKVWDAIYIIVFVFFIGLLVSFSLHFLNISNDNNIVKISIQLISFLLTSFVFCEPARETVCAEFSNTSSKGSGEAPIQQPVPGN